MSSVELNIRNGYGLEHNSVGVLMPNQKAEVSAEVISGGITWYKLKVGDVEGWASAKYLAPYKKNETFNKVNSGDVSNKNNSKSSTVKKSNGNSSNKGNNNGKGVSSGKTGTKSKTNNSNKSKVTASSSHSLNSYEKRLIELVNVERRGHGLNALKTRNDLSHVAKKSFRYW